MPDLQGEPTLWAYVHLKLNTTRGKPEPVSKEAVPVRECAGAEWRALWDEAKTLQRHAVASRASLPAAESPLTSGP